MLTRRHWPVAILTMILALVASMAGLFKAAPEIDLRLLPRERRRPLLRQARRTPMRVQAHAWAIEVGLRWYEFKRWMRNVPPLYLAYPVAAFMWTVRPSGYRSWKDSYYRAAVRVMGYGQVAWLGDNQGLRQGSMQPALALAGGGTYAFEPQSLLGKLTGVLLAKTRFGSSSPLFVTKVAGGLSSVVNMSLYPGKVLWVDSGETTDGSDTAGFGTNPDSPYVTLDFGVGQCTASQGDHIFVLPGHAETIATAAALDIDVAGITIRGIGHGDARPTFSFSDTGATAEFNADDMLIENLLVIGTKTGGVTKPFDVKTGADDLTLKDIGFRETANTLELLEVINIEATINRVTIDGANFKGVIGGDALACIKTEGAIVDLIIENCRANGDWLNSVCDLDASAITTPMIINCSFRNADPTNGFAVTLNTSTIAHLERCYFSNQVSNVVPVTGLNASFCLEVYGNDAVATNAIVMPALATAWT